MATEYGAAVFLIIIYLTISKTASEMNFNECIRPEKGTLRGERAYIKFLLNLFKSNKIPALFFELPLTSSIE